MNKSIRLLVEGFFDDDIFNTDNDIKTDIEDLGRYYDYKVGDIYYLNDEPYAICCGDKSYFKDKLNRFCLLKQQTKHAWRTIELFVKQLYFITKDPGVYYINTIKDIKYFKDNGYQNTQIIKNNYDINEFPAFKHCINLGDNVYLPDINELQIMYLNINKLTNNKQINNLQFSYTISLTKNVWSSTQCDAEHSMYLNFKTGQVYNNMKYIEFAVYPFFYFY